MLLWPSSRKQRTKNLNWKRRIIQLLSFLLLVLSWLSHATESTACFAEHAKVDKPHCGSFHLLDSLRISVLRISRRISVPVGSSTLQRHIERQWNTAERQLSRELPHLDISWQTEDHRSDQNSSIIFHLLYMGITINIFSLAQHTPFHSSKWSTKHLSPSAKIPPSHQTHE